MLPQNQGFAFLSRVLVAVTCSLMIVAFSGCGNKEPFDLVKVRGKVTYEDGSTIPAGRIIVRFISQTKSRDPKIVPRPGQTQVDAKTGAFEYVTTHEFGDGIVVGEHKVILAPASSAIPEEYTKVETTPLTVNSKDSPFDLKIKKPGGKKQGA
jgi:hypothetical protein